MACDVLVVSRSSLLAVAFAFVALCGRPAEVTAAPDIALPIPPRGHAPEAPPEGWCGETAIQEGLLTLGLWAPQRLVNRAGKPIHPDLYSSDLPVALTDLGVRFATYRGERGFAPYAAWASKAVDEGDPVIAGVKILPTKHPEWGLDHFVLVVGHGDAGLLVNTTWSSRRWVTGAQTDGLSFVNAFYGIRLLGLQMPAKMHPARLTVDAESATDMTLRVRCTGLTSGKPYRLELRGRALETPSWTEDFTADADTRERVVKVPEKTLARFWCAER